jgi:phosphoglycolate phosphatase-like HAD superfamily hydrolase
MAPPAALLDVDGTLVDTNYQHAIAWCRAFREHKKGKRPPGGQALSKRPLPLAGKVFYFGGVLYIAARAGS